MRDCPEPERRKHEAMTPEIIATLVTAVGMVAALGGLTVSLFLWLRSDIKSIETRVTDLGERMARVEGKLEFLERYITRQNEPPLAPAE